MRPLTDERCRVAIVGAGPQGLTVASYLVAAGVNPDDLVVIDPGGEWMVAWRRRFAHLGIAHLRSPSVHHPHPDPYALANFARERGRQRELVHPYGLPTTSLFDDFCAHVISEAGLIGAVRPDAVVSVEPTGGLRLARGAGLQPDHVIWATNPGVESGLCESGTVVSWESAGSAGPGDRVAVVGGGLTAAHLVERALAAGAHVEWLTRRAIVEREFDTDPGWLGPKEMQAFGAVTDPGERARRVDDARGGGTVPPWIMRRVLVAERSGRLCRRVGPVEIDPDDRSRPVVRCGGTRVDVDVVWSATGDRPCTTAAAPLDQLCDELGISRQSGRPELDRSLRLSGSVVHVAGRLAQLQLGPTAGNLAGARRAGELIVGAVVGAEAMYALSSF
ncbi:MAG: FAD/NAD(P)-binding protein [Acidimicrobiia bacterium]